MRDGSSRILGNASVGIWSVRFSPDGRHVAAGNKNGELLIWELRSGHLVASWKGHTDMVDDIAFMPNGEGLISFGIWDKALKYWDISGSTSTQMYMSDKKGHGVAGGAEQKKTSLIFKFVGHTVSPSLFLFRLLIFISPLSSHRLPYIRFPSRRMVNGSHPALLTVLYASGILALASSSAFCKHTKRTFPQFILALQGVIWQVQAGMVGCEFGVIGLCFRPLVVLNNDHGSNPRRNVVFAVVAVMRPMGGNLPK